MNTLPLPVVTPLAHDWFRRTDSRIYRAERALFATINGHRNIVELESVARSRPDPFRTLGRMRASRRFARQRQAGGELQRMIQPRAGRGPPSRSPRSGSRKCRSEV